MTATALQPLFLADLPVRTECPVCQTPLRCMRAAEIGTFAVCGHRHAHRVAGTLVETGAGDPHVTLRLGRRVR